MKMEEIESQTIEALEAMAIDLHKEIFQLRSELKMSRNLEKPHELTQKKRDRARVLTVLNRKIKAGK
ncbi:MAG: 50S ribosomal protein L29 [Simkaniaceae bacterium]|nr:50S ribosomal protein L29 [Simkaniaceae bacterium]MCF7851886.1 50S ribosomal protein L29 [Simkaniaceae bacterium]